MINVAKIRFTKHSDKYGNLVPIEGMIDIPFQAKRLYYIYGVDSAQRRGFHSHKALHQILICLHGSVKIEVDNGVEKEVFLLDKQTEGLYIGPMIWREMFEFQDEAVLLVLASEYFDENDYIRNYDKFLEAVERKYKK